MFLQRLALFVCLFLSAVSTVSANQGKLVVFVSIPPQKFVVEAIGGEYVQVNVMLDPGQSPEAFDPSSKKIKSLADGKIYFLIGVPFEIHWENKMQDANRDLKMIKTYGIEEVRLDEHDPHIWTSPAVMKRIAEKVLNTLANEDPERRNYYQNNFQRLLSGLDELDQAIKNKLSDRTTDYFIVSHASWGYFAREYGLQQVALESSGKEAGSRTLSRIIKLIRREGIRVVFTQEQYRTPAIEALAREVDADIIVLDPLAENYMENMQNVADRIAEAVR